MSNAETRTLVGTRRFTADGKSFTIEYYRTEKEAESGAVYGACLEKHVENAQSAAEESVSLPLTESRGHIGRIIDKLIGCEVTTIGFCETIDYVYDLTAE